MAAPEGTVVLRSDGSQTLFDDGSIMLSDGVDDCGCCGCTSCDDLPSSVLITMAGGDWGWSHGIPCSPAKTDSILNKWAVTFPFYDTICGFGGYVATQTDCVGERSCWIALACNTVTQLWTVGITPEVGYTDLALYSKDDDTGICDPFGTFTLTSSTGCSLPPTTIVIS
jgi:hypothetical protein